VTAPLGQRQAVRLETFTVGWNTLEAVVAIVAGTVASSVALVGFGLDSVVEVSAALVVLWQFRGLSEDREQAALRAIALCFWALAAYVTTTSVIDLAARDEPGAAPVGIALTALSVVVMPLLARAKRRTAADIGSRTLQADSRQTDLCTYLSASTLVGLALNALVGWWWADPLAALVIAYVAIGEGREAWAGKADDCC
jgi:divalent metal cation (Fe/Co/Zn/Cd) transporter